MVNYDLIKILILIVGIFLIALFLIKKVYKKFIILMISIIYVSGAIIYYMGYIGGSMDNHISISLIARSLFSAAAMFSFNSSFSDISNCFKDNSIYLVFFWVTHLLATISTLITLIYLLENKMRNTFKLIYSTFVKKYIILGINEYSIAFIKNLEKSHYKQRFVTVVIDDCEDNRFSEKLNQFNVAVLQGNIDDPYILKKAGIKKSMFYKQIYILVLGKDEIKNIDSVALLQELIIVNDNRGRESFIKSKRFLKDRVHIVVNSSTSEWVNYIDREELIDLKIFSKADIIARQFIKLCPTYSMIQLDTKKADAVSDYTMIIIGFGETGKQILLKVLSLSQYESNQFKAIIIDGNMTNLKGDFQRKYCDLIKNYNIDFHHCDIGSDMFNQLLDDNLININCVVICLQQDLKNIELGFDIKRLTIKYNISSASIQIAVKCNCQSFFNEKIKKEKINCENILFFGEIEEIFTVDIIINEKLDNLAKAINELYNINNPENATPWNMLSNFLKDANRHPAMHIKTKLNLVGLDTCYINEVPDGVYIIDTKEKFLDYLGITRLEALARNEHLRWNAFYYTSGWNVLPLEQADKCKDTKKRLHTCLVSWEELDKVSEKFGEDYKRKDIEQVENLIEYLKRIDHTIVISEPS